MRIFIFLIIQQQQQQQLVTMCEFKGKMRSGPTNYKVKSNVNNKTKE